VSKGSTFIIPFEATKSYLLLRVVSNFLNLFYFIFCDAPISVAHCEKEKEKKTGNNCTLG
jgi:hypothetical protein